MQFMSGYGQVMDKLTEDAVREIEQIHSSWIEFEVAGEGHSLMTLCADDIELLPRWWDARRFRRAWRTETREFTT